MIQMVYIVVKNVSSYDEDCPEPGVDTKLKGFFDKDRAKDFIKECKKKNRIKIKRDKLVMKIMEEEHEFFKEWASKNPKPSSFNEAEAKEWFNQKNITMEKVKKELLEKHKITEDDFYDFDYSKTSYYIEELEIK